VLPAERYLSEFYLQRRVRSAIAKHVVEPAGALFKRLMRRTRDDFQLPSAQDFLAPLAGATIEEIMTLMDASEADAKSIHGWVGLWVASDAPNASFDERLGLVASIAPQSKKANADQIWSDMKEHLCALPEDAMFLSDGIRTLGQSSKCGYVAYLRRVLEIREEHVALAPQDRIYISAAMVRVARITAPYIYHITQRLGSVFSSIGLPAEFDDLRRLTSEEIRP